MNFLGLISDNYGFKPECFGVSGVASVFRGVSGGTGIMVVSFILLS